MKYMGTLLSWQFFCNSRTILKLSQKNTDVCHFYCLHFTTVKTECKIERLMNVERQLRAEL